MNFILCLFIAFNLNAQEGSGFQEIDPAKDAVILKRIEAEKLLKIMAAKKKAEAIQAEAKRKEEEKKQAEEKKKKEVEETTRWLISERDRKLKEEADAQARKKPPVESKSSVSGKQPPTISEGLDWTAKKPRNQIHRIETHGTDYPVTIFPKDDCSFSANTKFPKDVKVLGIATYEGTFQGGRGFRHHPMTDVTLDVQEKGPVALVMWTYEPIRWTIKMNGGKLVGVLVIGYHEQKVDIEKEVPTIVSFLEKGKDQCRYSENNYDQQMEYQDRGKIRLSKFSQSLFGKQLTSFQYKYTLPPEVKVPDRN